MRRPSASMTSCTGLMSSALRTNDRATMSTPLRSAHRKSSVSFSLIAGTLTATPGRLIPLLLLTGPPTTTSVIDVGAGDLGRSQGDATVVDQDHVAGSDVSRTTPCTSVEHRSTVPSMFSTVIANVAPTCSFSLAVGKTAQPDLRALQVGDHTDRAAGRPLLPPGRCAGFSHDRHSPRDSY